MKKYLVIGNPIDHSLSPRLHNHWIKQHKINAVYEKVLAEKDDLKKIVKEIRSNKINGFNVTLPYKKTIIPLLDQLTEIAKKTQSVNTVYINKNKVIGDNTDSDGFKKAIDDIDFEIKNKSALIFGAGGVVPSIIYALQKLNVGKVYISNRTKKYADEIKKLNTNIEVVEWGVLKNADVIINATSLGLNENDIIDVDFSNLGKNKLFYDLIYNPSKTNFLKKGEELGNQIENGKKMFAYQAQLSFSIWNKVEPQVDKKALNILND